MSTPPKVPTTPAAAVAKPAAAPTAPPAPAPIALNKANPSTSSASPTVAVTVPNTSGTVTFTLVVTDDLGNKSPTPATATVTIQGPPTAVLSATPTTVSAGGTIELSGATSTTTGKLTNFLFTVTNPSN